MVSQKLEHQHDFWFKATLQFIHLRLLKKNVSVQKLQAVAVSLLYNWLLVCSYW